MTDSELKELVVSLAIAQKETDREIKELGKYQKKTFQEIKDSQKKTDEQMAETDRKLDKVAKLVGNISNNQGDVAEEFFFNSLKVNPHLGNIKFDDIQSNSRKAKNGIEDEFDILMTNGESIGIVEVKYKVHSRDIDKLRDKKISNFRKLYPNYSNYKLYVGIAGFHINDEAEESAKENGFFVLKRYGDIVKFDNSEEVKVY